VLVLALGRGGPRSAVPAVAQAHPAAAGSPGERRASRCGVNRRVRPWLCRGQLGRL